LAKGLFAFDHERRRADKSDICINQTIVLIVLNDSRVKPHGKRAEHTDIISKIGRQVYAATPANRSQKRKRLNL
jgi:hypothetical protein